MRVATVVQRVCKSSRTCFKFYCMFYFTCDRSFSSAYKAGSLRTPCLPGTKPTYRPLPHKCETHITSVYRSLHQACSPSSPNLATKGRKEIVGVVSFIPVPPRTFQLQFHQLRLFHNLFLPFQISIVFLRHVIELFRSSRRPSVVTVYDCVSLGAFISSPMNRRM